MGGQRSPATIIGTYIYISRNLNLRTVLLLLLPMRSSDHSAGRRCVVEPPMVSSNHQRRKRKRAAPLVLAIISGCLAAPTGSGLCDAFHIQPHHFRRPPYQSNLESQPYRYTPNAFNKSQRSTHLFMTNNEVDDSDGSIVGASLLFAGTAIGAGMIALPAETVGAGFIPSVAGLLSCWVFTYITSLVTLEASWLASSSTTSKSEQNNEGGGAGFLSISQSLGLPGEILTASLFWFLLTAIIVAYTAEGGQLISQFLKEVVSTDVTPAIGSFIFATFFASLATYGTSQVDAINRIFVSGLCVAFIGLVVVGLPMVKGSNLLYADWSMVYPPVISIGILSFGAQNVVPTLLQYLNYDALKTRKAILFGSLMPLILYTAWEAIFLGVIDTSNVDGNQMEVVSVLGQVGGPVVTDLVQVFSLCAIGSSMAGVSVSLVDFFQDAINILSKNESPIERQLPDSIKTRAFSAALALGPPVILAYAFPDIFLKALEEAGLLGGVSLYGILPAISILSLRRSSLKDGNDEQTEMPGRLGGGDVALIAIVAISSALVLPEIRDLL